MLVPWLPEITIRQPPKSAAASAAYLSMSIGVVRDMIQHLIDRLDLDRYIEKETTGLLREEEDW
jgi:hypothetical protein